MVHIFSQASIYFLPTIIYLHLTLEVLEANKSWDYLPRKIFLVERIYHNLEETLIVWIPKNLCCSMTETLRAAHSQEAQCEQKLHSYWPNIPALCYKFGPLIGRWSTGRGGLEKSPTLASVGTFCLVWRRTNGTILRVSAFQTGFVCVAAYTRKLPEFRTHR